MTRGIKMDSNEHRTALQEDVNELKIEASQLKKHEVQVWQFFFGQYPNGKDIEPVSTSWCGQISEGIKQLNRMTYFIVGTFLVFGIIDHRDAVIELFKIFGK